MQLAAQRVGWIFTSVERSTTHVHLYQSDYEFDPIDGPQCAPLALLPIDVNGSQSEPHERQLMAWLRPARGPKDFDKNLDHNLAAFARFFKAIGKISTVLGPGIQVGVQTWEGDVELSEVMLLSGFPD